MMEPTLGRALHLRDYPVGQERPARRGPRLAVLSTEATSPADDSWLGRARSLIEGDPRVASVSAAAPTMMSIAGAGRALLETSQPYEGVAYASEPVGDYIVVNSALCDLVTPPCETGGSASLTEWRNWARHANHRGLRHVWLVGGVAPGFQANAPVQGWPLSHADAREFADPLSGLSALRDRWVAGNLKLRVSVEASWLQENETGAQVATVCWLQALAVRPDLESIRLVGLPGGRLPAYAASLAGPKILVSRHDQDLVDDIYWRPYQPDAGTMLSRDRALGRRVVTTVLDLIEFSNGRYHEGSHQWAERRRQLRRYLRQTDLVTGISQDVLETVRREVPGVEAERLHRTALGVDHLAWVHDAPQPRWLQERCPGLGERPFLLVLGNDFVHKNRDFAIRVWRDLRQAVEIDLVLAGLHVSSSSTGDIEDRLLADVRTGPGRAHRLRHVPAEVKAWLLASASVVIYPTSAEGFGFIPHEAAALGSPSVFTQFGPLAEFCPDPAGLPAWQTATYADRIRELLTSADTRRDAVHRARAANAGLTWDAAAEELMLAFRSSLRTAPQPFGLWERTHGPRIGSARTGDPSEALSLTDARRSAALAEGWRGLARRGARRTRAEVRRVTRWIR